MELIRKLGGIVTIFLSIVLSPVAQSTDDDILDMLPGILAGVNKVPPPNPQWAVYNGVCCSASSATFSVTQGGITQSSVAPSCSIEATLSSYRETTPGQKTFSSILRSSGCGDLGPIVSPFTLEAAKQYVFVAEFEGGGVSVNVYSSDIALRTKRDSSSEGELTYNFSSMAKEYSAKIKIPQSPNSVGQFRKAKQND